ncbi:MAG: FMN-dependent NADH-azoreductase [Ralstonia sp.]|uniref:FMN-dependent NADH-azoreductase n=1 Tax=Ralstonia sp. TaxID=54061 RepID=UPI003F7DD143
MQVLHIDSSILGDASASRILSAAIVDELRRENPSATVVHRDLSVEAIPHLDGAIAAGFRATGADDFDDATRAEHARSETLVNELLASDVIVIGAPMYNFGISSQLKTYFDWIGRAGVTFRYTANGPEGLVKGKKVYVVSARGGKYAGTPLDSQTPHIQAFLGLIGITDVEFIYAEGLNMGPDAAGAALASAREAIAAAA